MDFKSHSHTFDVYKHDIILIFRLCKSVSIHIMSPSNNQALREASHAAELGSV